MAFNAVTLQNSTPSRHPGAERVFMGSIPRRTLLYFTIQSNAKYNTHLRLKNNYVSYLSVRNCGSSFSDYLDNHHSPALMLNEVTHLVQLPSETDKVESQYLQDLQSLLNVPISYSINLVYSLYRLIISIATLNISRI